MPHYLNNSRKRLQFVASKNEEDVNAEFGNQLVLYQRTTSDMICGKDVAFDST